MILSVVKVFIPAIISFFIGIGITPTLTNFFYRHKLWKRRSRKIESSAHAYDQVSPDFKRIHNESGELSTPRIGGVIVWLSVFATIVFLYINSFILDTDIAGKLDFLSKNQTLLPLAALFFGSLIGLLDDLLQIFGDGSHFSDGISRRYRILIVLLIGAVGAWWFYFKLENFSIHVPFDGSLDMGLLFIPFFMIVMLGTFSGSIIDGIDGLGAGVLTSIFSAYMVIAYVQNQIDLAAFCAVIIGGLLAFLWFNIPPARFYLGETGMLGLTVTIAIVAFLTQQVLVLPIIAFPLVVTSLSSTVQIISKKYFKRKVFKVAPLHHHFEAIGWPSYKVTMRYWVISAICAMIGTLIAIIN